MGGVALVAALAVILSQQADTSTFADRATAELFARARVRHIRQDSLVKDYRARVRTRIEAASGRSRFARLTSLFVHETDARVAWQSPNDLRVEVRGARTAIPLLRMVRGLTRDLDEEVDRQLANGLSYEALLDRPWFIPRALGDSIRLMGVPDRAALHPLATRSEREYHYAIVDSVALRLQTRTVRAIRMRVTPERLGPSMVAGEIWLDSETADVVRLTVVFVGEYLWEEPQGNSPEDSAKARNANKWANRFLTTDAEIEYALVNELFWMPRRQVLLQTLRIPWIVNATVPVRAVTTFEDYEVNTGRQISFDVPLVEDDTVEAPRVHRQVKGGDTQGESRGERWKRGYYQVGVWDDGRWEVSVPPADSLIDYAWETEFRVSLDVEEERRLRESIVSLATIEEELPSQWIGRPRGLIAWEQVSDLFRFNRVQGPSLGLGYQWRPGPNFTTLMITGRFGFADLRPTGSLTWRRDGPGGWLEISGFRRIQEFEPWTAGLSIGNSLNALFTAHDDADYYLTLGGGVAYTGNDGILRDVEMGAFFERHRSTQVESGSVIADLWGSGDFAFNPPVTDRDFFRGWLARVFRLGPVEWRNAAEVLAGEATVSARLSTALRLPFVVANRTGTLTLRGGLTRGDEITQLLLRAGGPQTVRGYTYGTRVGREFWSGQLDLALTRNAFVAPVAFVDVGDTFTSDPLVGLGAGLSVLNGTIRFNLSKGVNPGSDLRFDLLFRAPR
jgi:hypothetical protein